MILKSLGRGIFINGQATNTDSKTGLIPVFIPNSTTQSFTFKADSGAFNGSQILINALSQNNKTSLITSTAAVALNNQPVPIQIVEQQSYIANVSTTQVAQAGTQQSISTGQINYGFTLNVLPTIDENNVIHLQMSINISSLRALNNFALQGAMVQLPDMIQRNAMQKISLHDNETYVITGFDNDVNQSNNTGFGKTSNWWFGGGKSTKSTHNKLIILVTPRILIS